MGAFDGLRLGQIDHGYYGHHTSTIDWCELNYTHSPYIAEFYNTLTNVPVMLIGIWGCYASLRDGMRQRVGMSYLGLTGIGLGSFGFHASLRWEWQLMDELPMIYLISFCAYLVLDTLPSFKPRFGIAGPLCLLSWDILVTFSYIYLPNPIYHQLAFGCILLFCITRNVLFVRRLSASHPRHSAKAVRTLVSGIATFAGGFLIWNVDNFFCKELRQGQNALGPLGFLLQGHGYWHLMTGYGAFLIMTASTYLQHAMKISPEAYDYDAQAWLSTVYPVDLVETLGKRALGASRPSAHTHAVLSEPIPIAIAIDKSRTALALNGSDSETSSSDASVGTRLLRSRATRA